MSYDSDHVSIVITKTPKPEHWDGPRWQPYHWAAITPNGQTLAVSSERYTNRDDMVDAITLLLSGKVPIRIVEGEETFEIAARADADRWVRRILDEVPNGHAESVDCDPDYPATEVQG